MPFGPSKYDAELSVALASIRRGGPVAGGILIVVGEPGGFACQATAPLLVVIPDLLRSLADQIEADMKRGEI
jgi:hypothetical protein